MAELTLRELWALSAAVRGVDVCADLEARSDVLSMTVTFLGLKETRPELLTIFQRHASLTEQDITLRGRPARLFSAREFLTVCTTEAGHAALRAAGLDLPGTLTPPRLIAARRQWALVRLDEQLTRAERAWALVAEREPELGEQDQQILAAAIYLCELERAIKSPDATTLTRWFTRRGEPDLTAFVKCDGDGGANIPLVVMLAREGVEGVRVVALVRWAQQVGVATWPELMTLPEPTIKKTEAVVAEWRER